MSIQRTGGDDSARRAAEEAQRKAAEAARQKAAEEARQKAAQQAQQKATQQAAQQAQQKAAQQASQSALSKAPPSSGGSRAGLAGISGHQLQSQLHRQLGGASLPSNSPNQGTLSAQAGAQPSRPLSSDGLQSAFFQRQWNAPSARSSAGIGGSTTAQANPGTLESEATRDSNVNCIDNAQAILSKDPKLAAQGNVVFLQDTRNTDGNNAGHVVIERPDGTYIDPNRPQEPVSMEQLQAQGYAPVDAQGRPVGDPAEAYRLPAQDFQRAMSLPPDRREAALDAAGIPEPIQGMRLADGGLKGWFEENIANPLNDNVIQPAGQAINDHILEPLGSAAQSVNDEIARATGVDVFGAVQSLGDLAADAKRLLLDDPGANSPYAVNRDQITATDKAALNVLGLDNIPPGGSTTFEVKVEGELSAVLGVEAGATVELSVSRGLPPDQDQFTLGLGAGAELSAEVTGDTAGAEATGSVGVGVNGGIELQIDLSKPGAATELAAFGVQLGIASTNPIAGVGLEVLDQVGDRLFGRDVTPGTPSEFVRDHLSSISIGANTNISETLGLIEGVGGRETVTAYLEAGAQVSFDRNADGRPYISEVTQNIAAGANIDIEAGAGAGGVNAVTSVAGGGMEVGFERTIHFNEDGTKGETTYAITLGADVHGGLGPVGAGFDGEIKIELGENIPPQFRGEMLDALGRGDVAGARDIFLEQVLPNMSLTGSISLSSQVQINAKGEIMPAVAGAGGGVSIEGTITQQQMLFTGEVSIDQNGITATFTTPDGQHTASMTFRTMQEMTAFFGEAASDPSAFLRDPQGFARDRFDPTYMNGDQLTQYQDRAAESHLDNESFMNDMLDLNPAQYGYANGDDFGNALLNGVINETRERVEAQLANQVFANEEAAAEAALAIAAQVRREALADPSAFLSNGNGA